MHKEKNMYCVATSGCDIEIQFLDVVKIVEKLCNMWQELQEILLLTTYVFEKQFIALSTS